MVWAIIAIAFFVGLVYLLLFSNVTVTLHYDDRDGVFRCSVRYLFLNYIVSPKKEKKKRKNKKQPKKKKKSVDKPSPIVSIYKEKGAIGFVKSLQTVVNAAWKLFVSILRNVTLRNLLIRLSITGEDAADTAISFGWANSVVYPIVGALLDNVADYEDYTVELIPDYNHESSSSVEFDMAISIRPVTFIAVMIRSYTQLRDLLAALTYKPKHEKEK
ncbi:MAG: DUF2953 domain-containing protein [Ruminococcus sp.]|nr:DUF2953 domain-containing protein [Ruminococcus sp.]